MRGRAIDLHPSQIRGAAGENIHVLAAPHPGSLVIFGDAM
jgi:hypothetical protein